MYRSIMLLLFLVSNAPVWSADTTMTSALVGYSIKLPSGWIRIDSAAGGTTAHHIFADGTGKYKAVLGIKSNALELIYESERDWCIEASYTYELWVLAHVIGQVFLRDTTQIQGKFAVGTNAMYVWQRPDGHPERIAEYMVHTAKNKQVYQLYVSSDTTDMAKNYTTYSNLIANAQLGSEVTQIRKSLVSAPQMSDMHQQGSTVFRAPMLLNGRQCDNGQILHGNVLLLNSCQLAPQKGVLLFLRSGRNVP
jgi:hypothetical protein